MKRSSQAGPPEAGTSPAGSLAQPDERDLTPESGRPPDRLALGPRRIIAQALQDVACGLQDTDRHGTPNDLPLPVGAVCPLDPFPIQGGGSRHSFAADQGGKPR